MNVQTRKRLSREESQAQTRERLVEAARRLFVQRGFGGTSIRDIADEAGYSQGGFYSNFASKEALLLELLRQHMRAEAMQLNALIEAAEHLDGDVLAGLEAWSMTLDQDADWAMLAVELQLHANRSAAFAEEYRHVWDGHRLALGGLVARVFARLRKIPPVEPAELAAGLMALAHGQALQHVVYATQAPGRMIMVFLRGVLASSADDTSPATAATPATAH